MAKGGCSQASGRRQAGGERQESREGDAGSEGGSQKACKAGKLRQEGRSG